MIIICVIVSLLFTIFFIATDDDTGLAVFSLAAFIACVVWLIVCIVKINTSHIINDKIQMYEEENDRIESQINILIENYMKYEQDTFIECSGESLITLIDMYPELKSDTLVSKQIDIYVSNNDAIKQLKLEQIEVSTYKFLVYFGH